MCGLLTEASGLLIKPPTKVAIGRMANTDAPCAPARGWNLQARAQEELTIYGGERVTKYPENASETHLTAII